MRIVIDLQGAQTTSARRGIGRYSLALARSMVRQGGQHEFIIVLNGALPGSIEPIRAAFEGLIEQANIRVWEGLSDVAGMDPSKRWRREATELIREAFLADLAPDVVHVASLFEGQGEDAATSIGMFCPGLATAVTLYDLIPLLYREFYLSDYSRVQWYETKLAHLKRAKLLLAISEATRRDAIDLLSIPAERVTNISAAADEYFQPCAVPAATETALRERFGVVRPFVMSAGGPEHRKNLEGMIRGFALLPIRLRHMHQLALVGPVHDAEQARLLDLADQYGLGRDEIVFTGFVSDNELVTLYNLAKVFCFPSLHEGFGLPVLEAMACGAPVIASNNSSLKEVVARSDALFSPTADLEIAARLQQVLSDDNFRESLRDHGLKRALEFSWNTTGKRALEALECCVPQRTREEVCTPAVQGTARSRLIYVSPLPPDSSGIAEYSVELIQELSNYYDIDLVVHKDPAKYRKTRLKGVVRSLNWFDSQPVSGQRIIYQFGNSEFHSHMFSMLERQPGIVVLHDFFLGDLAEYREHRMGNANVWSEALYDSHGYQALVEKFAKGAPLLAQKYPSNLLVLQLATGVITHSSYSRELARQWFGDALTRDWAIIPQPRAPGQIYGKARARRRLSLSLADYVVCSFGMIGSHKGTHRLLDAWLESRLAKEKHCRLVLIGEISDEAYGRALIERIRLSGVADRISVTGFVASGVYQKWLVAADLAVQLRSNTRGETSRAVLDCMSYGLPTIVNRHGAMRELPDGAVFMIDDAFTDDELRQALDLLYLDAQKRREVGERALIAIKEIHSPSKTARLYFEAIEKFQTKASRGREGLIARVAKLDRASVHEHEWCEVAKSISSSLPLRVPERQLLVDISALVETDLRTGIQRVVRNVLKHLLEHPPAGFRVEPVYATLGGPYRYARRFVLRFLGCPEGVLNDDPIETHANDIFLGLDLHPVMVKSQAATIGRMRERGIKVYFVVYDLLWTFMPQVFFDWMCDQLDEWLEVVLRSDGAIAISKAVADILLEQIEAHPPKRSRRFDIGWFHLGADLITETWTQRSNNGLDASYSSMAEVKSPFILMVGTIEPRKGYAQALSAFEELWRRGAVVSLVIAGKQGWMVEELVNRIRNHPEAGRRLFWLMQVSDEDLEALYRSAKGLLLASEGEGFGLPLIEAARRGCSILARDLAVFHEVAREHAAYFRGADPAELANALSKWLEELDQGSAPQSNGMPIQTWAQSAEQLLSVILDANWYAHWDPQASARNSRGVEWQKGLSDKRVHNESAAPKP